MAIEEGGASPQGIGLRSGLVADLPIASVAFRNKFFYIRSVGGTADIIYICMKTSADTYVWVKWRDGDGGEFVSKVTGI
jgi:hypothetical protein